MRGTEVRRAGLLNMRSRVLEHSERPALDKAENNCSF
jgi:hypothetical protein